MDSKNTERGIELLALEKITYILSIKYFDLDGDVLLNLSEILDLYKNYNAELSEDDDEVKQPFLIGTYCILKNIIFDYEYDKIQFHEPTLKTKFVKLLQRNQAAEVHLYQRYEILPYKVFEDMMSITIDFLKNEPQNLVDHALQSLYNSSSYCNKSSAVKS